MKNVASMFGFGLGIRVYVFHRISKRSVSHKRLRPPGLDKSEFSSFLHIPTAALFRHELQRFRLLREGAIEETAPGPAA